MKIYAIRHKPTGRFMPARMTRTGRGGWSHWEPSVLEAHDRNPRIFFTLQSARNALTMWLQGCWREAYTQGNYFEAPEPIGPEPNKPRVERKRDDMEIVVGELAL